MTDRLFAGRFVAAALVAGSLSAFAPAASAQAPAPATAEAKSEAEALFNAGVRLMEEGKVAEACEKFAASQAAEAHPATLLRLGDCYEKLGKTASAWAAYRDAASLGRTTNRDQYIAQGTDLASAIEPKLSKLQVDATTVPGLVLTRDGEAFSAATLGVPVAVDPGEHVIEASAKGFKTQTVKVTIASGATIQQITVPPLEAAPEETVVPPSTGGDANDGSTQRMIGYVVGGVGIVGLGLGGVMGLLASSDASGAEDDASLCPNKVCTSAGRAQIDSAETKALVSTIGIGVGAAALAGGIILILTAPSAPDAPAQSTGQLVPVFDAHGGGFSYAGRF